VTTANIERHFPVNELSALARKERPDLSRPPLYLHKWWARRFGSVFRSIILSTFLPPEEDAWDHQYQHTDLAGKIVLDPFMGGGTTVFEALRLGCRVVGCDLNPVAWWTTKAAIEQPESPKALWDAFRHLDDTVGRRIKDLYRTQCPICGREADVIHVRWVKVVPCKACGQQVRLHNNYVLGRRGKEYAIFCPDCGDVFKTHDPDEIHTCPSCGNDFWPREGTTGRGTFTCPAPGCGQRQTVLEAQSEGEPPDYEMYAVVYECPAHGWDIKSVSEQDRAVYREAERVFDRARDELAYPTQEIPTGRRADPRPVNYGYTHWHQMFTPRQLLALGWLVEAIQDLPSDVQDTFITTFSYLVNYTSIFCTTRPTRISSVGRVFTHHAFIPPTEGVENNPWGNKRRSGTYPSLFTDALKAYEYRQQPFERRLTPQASSATQRVPIPGDRVDGRLADNFKILTGTEKNALLLCQSSQDLPLPESSVDAVITDPPYFDNVMYGELSDFFYVWLRLFLKDRYPFFASAHTPKMAEIVKNTEAGKDEDFFLSSLTMVFEEARRVLKDEGLMVFTFHHREHEAWSSVMGAVLDAGFYVSAIYPVQAEMSHSLHIRNQQAIEYDSIIVCRKRVGDGRISWEQLEDQVHFQAAETLEQLQENAQGLSRADVSVIVLGKCLELYSKHYPNVMEEEQSVSVREAIDRLWTIIDSLAVEEVLSRLPASLDEVTKAYAITLAGRHQIPYDELNKRLRHRGLSTDIFSDEQLVEIEGKTVRVAAPGERRDHLEVRLERGQRLLDIDRVHYLYVEYRYGANFRQFRTRWRSQALDELCRYLAEVTGDSVYDKIVEAAF
jgi:adenine-specific DNA methylase